MGSAKKGESKTEALLRRWEGQKTRKEERNRDVPLLLVVFFLGALIKVADVHTPGDDC